jgi:hypothetical protein
MGRFAQQDEVSIAKTIEECAEFFRSFRARQGLKMRPQIAGQPIGVLNLPDLRARYDSHRSPVRQTMELQV